jgi:signal peptidase II
MLGRLWNSGWRFGGVALVVIALDQWSKALVIQSLPVYGFKPVWSWFAWTHLHNTGASFSLLADASGWQQPLFLGLALAISAFIAVTLTRIPATQGVLAVALALILGGALGNAFDRWQLGYVVDFISVHWANWFFPAFNVADSAITVGAVLMFVDALSNQERS